MFDDTYVLHCQESVFNIAHLNYRLKVNLWLYFSFFR